MLFFSGEGCYKLNHSVQQQGQKTGYKKVHLGNLVDGQSVTDVNLQNCCWCKTSSNCISVTSRKFDSPTVCPKILCSVSMEHYVEGMMSSLLTQVSFVVSGE